MKEKINIYLELAKIKITVFVMLTTALGYITAAGEINTGIILPCIGILLVACGSAAINHLQERKTDALMNRTKNRPLPSGKITPQAVLVYSLALILSGTFLLIYISGILAASLALLNLVWYNLIYTPLKKKNPLAIIPGSVVGAIPPAVGWVAGGGYILDPQIIIISFFFFIWQIPHFWLLLLVLGKDYEKAGFPSLTRLFTNQQLGRITFVWISATVVTALLIPLFGIVEYSFVKIALFLAGIWLIVHAARMLGRLDEKLFYRYAFNEINIFAVLIVLFLSLDKII
jgi:protoheme IX farnesyltransferase